MTRFPVILFGRAYSGLIDWIRSTMAETGTISPADLELFTVTDDVAEAVAVIQAADDARKGDGGGGMRAPLDQGPLDA